MKLALCAFHRLLPPSLHFVRPNPNIPFAAMGVAVQQTVERTPSSFIAGLNSFGFGGTNAHAVVQSVAQPVHADGTRAVLEGCCIGGFLAVSARSVSLAAKAVTQLYTNSHKTRAMHFNFTQCMLCAHPQVSVRVASARSAVR